MTAVPDAAAIRHRLNGATPGPWKPYTTGGWDHSNFVCRSDYLGVAMEYALVWEPGDADFIARAPDDIASLLAEVDRLTEALATAEAKVERVEAVRDEWGEPFHCSWLSASVLVRQLRTALAVIPSD